MKCLKTTVLSLLLIVTTNSFAQTYFTISGKVSADANGTVLQAASVFAQNTTVGTVTDAEGNFKLSLPNGGYDLIISYTGYKTEIKRITTADANESIQIKLKEKEKELEAVAVTSSNEVTDGMAKYGSFFKDEFIGKSINAQQCSLQNPEVLHFFFSKKKNRLKITATSPLIIKNNALGYNIKYALDSFTHEYKTEISTYTGYPLFENMLADSIQMQKWNMARNEAYKGSTLHFMRSLFRKSLNEEKFEIQFIIKGTSKDEAIKLKDVYAALNYEKTDSTQTVEVFPNQNNVGVLYTAQKPSNEFIKENPSEPKDFKFSMMSIKPNESIIIEQNGYYYDQNDVTTSGYWAWDKVGDQLPYDYVEF